MSEMTTRTRCACLPDRYDVTAVDTRHMPEGAAERVTRAAFDAADAAGCCLRVRNAVLLAVFDAARAEGCRIAYGDILDDSAPDFVMWPADTLHRSTVRDVVGRGGEITGHMARDIRARLAGAL